MRSKTLWILLIAIVGVGVPVWAAEYKVDNAHSMAMFRVHHLGAGYIHGSIPDVSGTVTFDPANPGKNSIEVSAKVKSLTTFNTRRDNHLKGPDFFDSKQFADITFKSDSWKPVGDGLYEITGKFTLLGVTKTVTAKARHTGFGKQRGKELAGFEATFTIDRTDFGMTYGVAEKGGLGKEITITIALECGKS